MDAVRIEHFLAHALGIEVGKRGEVNDADYVRSGEPKYLVRALEKVLPRLKKRAGRLDDSDKMKMWIEHSIGDLSMTADSILKASDRNEISASACFQLWSLSATSVNLIDSYLRGCNC
jgi:hypothetical protein